MQDNSQSFQALKHSTVTQLKKNFRFVSLQTNKNNSQGHLHASLVVEWDPFGAHRGPVWWKCDPFDALGTRLAHRDLFGDTVNPRGPFGACGTRLARVWPVWRECDPFGVLGSLNPQPWRFTNNSFGLPHAHFLFVCLSLWVCVVCVCFLLYLSVYSLSICVAHSVCFEFCCMFMTNCFQFQNLHVYHTAVHIPLLIFLYFSSTCICIVSILVCVYPHTYANLPPSSRIVTFASECIHIFIHVSAVL